MSLLNLLSTITESSLVPNVGNSTLPYLLYYEDDNYSVQIEVTFVKNRRVITDAVWSREDDDEENQLSEGNVKKLQSMLDNAVKNNLSPAICFSFFYLPFAEPIFSN